MPFVLSQRHLDGLYQLSLYILFHDLSTGVAVIGEVTFDITRQRGRLLDIQQVDLWPTVRYLIPVSVWVGIRSIVRFLFKEKPEKSSALISPSPSIHTRSPNANEAQYLVRTKTTTTQRQKKQLRPGTGAKTPIGTEQQPQPYLRTGAHAQILPTHTDTRHHLPSCVLQPDSILHH